MSKRIFINEQIWAKELRLIDEQGKQIGVISREEALKIANEKELDLVEVGPTANPPVCRIINFDKFRFQLEKKEKKQKKTSKRTEIKEVRIGVRTGEHDLDFKKAQALKFLKKGKKVKLELVLKGRERAHKELAWKLLNDFSEKVAEEGEVKIEQRIMGSPRGFNCILSK